MNKIPLLVEIIGEPEAGKTTFSLKFPSPVIVDTTVKGEALAIIQKMMPLDLWRWRNVQKFKSLQDMVKESLEKPEVKTIILDTSPDLQKMAADLYLETQNAQGKSRERVLQIEYGRVRDLVDNVVRTCIESGKNVVFTSLLKDEYKSVIQPNGLVTSYNTGNKIRDGYQRAPKMCDLRFFLELKQEDKGGTTVTTRTCKVVKNRFRDKAGAGWVDYLTSIDWEGTVKLITEGTGIGREMLVE